MSERRYDPTHGEWVTFATHRQDRTYKPSAAACPLCPTVPGHEPTEIPREHFDVVVFDNRFPSLSTDPPEPSVAGTDLVPVEPAYGHCEVVVFTDDHDATLASVGVARVTLLVETWARRVADLGADPGVRYVLPFENKGEAVGVTLHHPHGQIYAYPDVPPRPARELAAGRRHHERTGHCVFCDVVAAEAGGAREVVAGEHFVAAVPPWARFPYEVDIWSREHVPSLPELSADARADLARVLAKVLATCDAWFGFSTSYLLGIHAAPTDGTDRDVAHLHLEICPPHRGGGKLKYLAGSETFGGAFLTDVAPEVAAARLREAAGRAVVPA
ncbi:galactose-1-phosphate uridylyltransferase [Actinomycetospora sp. NBRC 106375]|uniref:galactose-1-phosphate uridylyltransferase n=1 Tax=Actinomycetospora sp. NBRC 106375 TaxID=3032207 RepID=UPI0024A52440|nr:galactose-1-phosphate uridylyltransferase [Actinomycetospora sp. NBRC 106375]GLZ47533.1 galactose-1-phosphate uridylyltransferase [Actinomycetospora sp. NBRC 106375]